MRRQIEARQQRTDTTGNWFRVGILSATVLAPLIARWNDLRTSNRAKSLRELAATRLGEAREQAAVRLAPVREIASERLGDVREVAAMRLAPVREAAGAQLDTALERLAQARTPEMLQNVLPFSLARKRAQELQRRRQQQRRRTMMLWMAGVGIGLAAAGAAAYVIARRRMAASLVEEEPMVELPHERNLAEATVGKASTSRGALTTEQTEINVPAHTFATTAGTAPSSDQARYIGNIHTMVFHDADDTEHLPAEENRIYFSSEAEAEQAGYHHAGEPEGSSEAGQQ